MKYIYNLTFKMSISATISFIIGNLLNLKYSTVAAVIAILSIQDTRKKALILGKKRILACNIGIFLSVIVYFIFGHNPISFGIFLMILIPITSKINIQDGMVPAVVLSTHILIEGSINIELLVNELLLMLVGVGVAAIANIFMPSLEDDFKEDKKWIENSYRIIISKMSKSLYNNCVDIDEQTIIDNIKLRLDESSKRAYKIASNSFFSNSSYYTDYINMRINQFDIINRMRSHFFKFNITVEQMKEMAQFTQCVAENIREMNDCTTLLKELESLRNKFKKMDLPKTREEFESRAQLLQFLNDMEEFLIIKRNFSKIEYK